jgi:hypothetical protein
MSKYKIRLLKGRTIVATSTVIEADEQLALELALAEREFNAAATVFRMHVVEADEGCGCV